MTGSNFRQLQVSLARWKKPSAWDRVLQDEPLDQVQGEWVPDGACNFATTGTTITIPVGTVITNNAEDFSVTTAATKISFGYNTWQSSAYGYSNEPQPGQRWEPTTWLPYPRNRNEKRTLKAIEGRLSELVEVAEEKFGLRGQGSESEWNTNFWKMVARKTDDHFLKTRK